MKKFYLPLMLLAASLCACGDDSPSDNPGGGGEPGGGPSGGVTDVVNVISDLTLELSTDKACYLPGDVVSFTADGTLPADARVRYRRGTEVVEEGNLGGNTWTWTPPSTDFTGYLADVYRTRDDGTQVILGTIGVDVSSDWTRFPRYGFVATFDDSKLQPGVSPASSTKRCSSSAAATSTACSFRTGTTSTTGPWAAPAKPRPRRTPTSPTAPSAPRSSAATSTRSMRWA